MSSRTSVSSQRALLIAAGSTILAMSSAMVAQASSSNSMSGGPEVKQKAGTVSARGGEKSEATGRNAGSDATVTWTGAGGNPNWSTAANWTPGVPQAATVDAPTFPTTLTGNFTTNNDLGVILGRMSVARNAATDVTTLTGGYRGTGITLSRGSLVIDGGTSVLTDQAALSISVGSTTATVGASLTIQNGANVAYGDALVSGNSTNPAVVGNLTVTGPTTVMTQNVNTFDGYFGGNGGNTNVLITNGATVNAWLARSSLSGTFKVTGGGTLNINPLIDNTDPLNPVEVSGLAYVGNVTNSNVNWEVSGAGSTYNVVDAAGASFSAPDNFGFSWIGPGGGTTNGTISGGGKYNGGIIGITGHAPSSTTSTTSTVILNAQNTLTVTGAGSEMTATGVIGVGGLGIYSNQTFGRVTLNVLDGGLVSAPWISLGSSDAPSQFTVTPTTGSPFTLPTPGASTTTLVSGTNSRLISNDGAGDGQINLVAGDFHTATTTVENGGVIDAFLLVDSGVSNTAIVNVNAGGTLKGDFVEVGGGAGSAGTSVTFNVTGGGQFLAQGANGSIITGNGKGGSTTINVSGASSKLVVDQFYQAGGFSSSTSSGTSSLNVTDGATADLGIMILGVADLTPSSVDANGFNAKVSGAGSVINVKGYSDILNPANNINADIVLATSQGHSGKIEVLDGGVINVLSDTTAPDISGSLFMATSDDTTAVVTVDGAGSTFHAGTLVVVAQGDPEFGLIGASGIINVRNGGRFDTTGNIQLGTTIGDSVTAQLNIGAASGATASDVDTLVRADVTLFVGGSGPSGAPIVGTPSQVTMNNGKLEAGALLVYQGSTVTLNKSKIDAGGIAARGGVIAVNAAAPAADNVMLADSFEATDGGYIDIGKGGGVSQIFTTGETDLADIKALILAGRNGGTWDGVNGIRSAFVAANAANYAIGYADIDAASMTSFLGIPFVAADQGIAFRATRFGDANLDGLVNFNDLLALAKNYNGITKEWYQGDFDYNGSVNFNDLLALAKNYNQSALADVSGLGSDFAADWALAVGLTPEPASLAAVLGLGGLVLRRRR